MGMLGRTTDRTKVGRQMRMRVLHRSFTARLLRRKASLEAVRRLLNRGSVGAASVCLRIADARGSDVPGPLSSLSSS